MGSRCVKFGAAAPILVTGWSIWNLMAKNSFGGNKGFVDGHRAGIGKCRVGKHSFAGASKAADL